MHASFQIIDLSVWIDAQRWGYWILCEPKSFKLQNGQKGSISLNKLLRMSPGQGTAPGLVCLREEGQRGGLSQTAHVHVGQRPANGSSVCQIHQLPARVHLSNSEWTSGPPPAQGPLRPQPCLTLVVITDRFLSLPLCTGAQSLSPPPR